jgi:hypothetical protein
MTRLRILAVVLFAALVVGPLWPVAEASAAVVCQKKNRIRIRPETCKKKEIRISTLVDDVAGIWHYTTGGSSGDSILAGETDSKPEFITLNADGTGRLNLVDPDTGVLTCGRFAYSRGTGLSVDLSQFSFSGTAVWQGQVEGDTLSLSDAAGNTSTFERAAEVAPEFECKTFTENARFEGLPEPESFSGLAFDGTSLWYEEENTEMIQQVDPASGALGTPVDLSSSQFSHVHAMQAGDFWAHCGCGGSQEAQRRTMADVFVDEVDTENDLGEEISVRGIAYDPAGARLWLQGSMREGARSGVLLEVDSDAEPDVLISTKELDVSLRSMTFDGTNFWGVSGSGGSQVVIQFNPNAQVLATYESPDNNINWIGIAAVAGQLYIVGESTGSGVIIAVTP